ncbi:hypothetical protein Tsubulata_009581 [Turnera subulata]|uniref:TRAF-type domain-containing protein n=1 Tax=Turnera subulata TaxID=218843 RepID=A0A9Q0JR65_9ROSI|nr:hypothetical protein Tsubulata_009581 [Turnera subulata]
MDVLIEEEDERGIWIWQWHPRKPLAFALTGLSRPLILICTMLTALGILKNVACSLCSETMEREILAVHKGENCPQRIVTCEFCEFPLPAVDLAEHQEVCGNRTELCHLCNKYIRLRERYNHEISCTGMPDSTAGSSRDVRVPERAQGPPRRQPQEFSRKRIIFTIAITGIAVLLGSFLFQRKPEMNQMH